MRKLFEWVIWIGLMIMFGGLAVMGIIPSIIMIAGIIGLIGAGITTIGCYYCIVSSE